MLPHFPSRLTLTHRTLLALLVCTAAARAQITITPTTSPAKPTLGENNETLITLHLKDAQPEDVFSAIGKQAGLRFQFQPENVWDAIDGTVTVDFDQKPFLQVLHDLCVQFDLTPQNNGNSARRLTLYRNPGYSWAKRPTYASGPFILSADNANYSRSINFGNSDAVQSGFSLQFSALADPNAHIVSYSTNLEVTEAVDDHDNNLVMERNDNINRGGNDPGRNLFLNFNAQLLYPATNPGTKITKLKGNISAVLAVKTETIQFDDLAAAGDTTKTAGDFTIVLHSVTPESNNNQRIGVKITISTTKPPDNRPGNGLYGLYNLANSAQLVDAKSHVLNNQGASGGGNLDHSDYTLYFGRDFANGRNDAPAPALAKLSFEVPTEIKEVSLPIELTDLKMP